MTTLEDIQNRMI